MTRTAQYLDRLISEAENNINLETAYLNANKRTLSDSAFGLVEMNISRSAAVKNALLEVKCEIEDATRFAKVINRLLTETNEGIDLAYAYISKNKRTITDAEMAVQSNNLSRYQAVRSCLVLIKSEAGA